MLVLGIESSCDETGVALYDTQDGLLAQALHSQAAMHERYGGVVPELASRDHIERLTPLLEGVMRDSGRKLDDIDAIAYTQGPGLAGALLVGASVATALAYSIDKPILGIHHLEGHLLSPLLSDDPPAFPFVALLVSGGHTQLLRVDGLGDYTLLGETVDDAAGEAFDKSAKLLELGYPGGPALSALAATADLNAPDAPSFSLPRPKLKSDDLDFSFSGLKTAVLTQVRKGLPPEHHPYLAREVEEAITDVLVGKALKALEETGLTRLVISGGVSANHRLRAKLAEAREARIRRRKPPFEVHFPALALCTDNGAMIAFAGALRLAASGQVPQRSDGDEALRFDVRPRWPLEELEAAGPADQSKVP